MTVTLQKLLDEGIRKVKECGVPDAELDCRYLLMEAFSLSPSQFLLRRGQELLVGQEDARAVSRYLDMIACRCSRIPLQYILGTQSFMGLEFKVDQRVLIPRQDTEDLVELVLKEHPNTDESILDMCTGSGCIAISLAVLGGYQRVTAVDVSEDVLRAAGENAQRLGAAEIVRCVRSSMFEAEAQIKGPKGRGYSIIVSNPPYIPTQVIAGLMPEVKDYEPVLALDGMEDGLHFYRILAAEGRRFLLPGGAMYVEIGYDQADAVRKLFDEAGFIEIEVIKDTPGLDRIVKARYGPTAG